MLLRKPRETAIMLIIFLIFLAPLAARAALYALSNAPRSYRDADWSSTGMLPPASRDQAGARDRVHRHHRSLEGHFLGAQLGGVQARERAELDAL